MLAGRRPAWMGRAYSDDLRERVVRAVIKGGLSRHQAAAQFGVGISTAINWLRRFHETGSVKPDQLGAKEDCRAAPRMAGATKILGNRIFPDHANHQPN